MSRLPSLTVALRALQVLLALFFALASGAPKLFLPPDALGMPIPLAQSFIWFIGTCEVLGALGLVIPLLARRVWWLTPVAASCLTLLTLCAAAYQFAGHQPGNAVFALTIGVLCALVVRGAITAQRAHPAQDPSRPQRDHSPHVAGA